MASQVAILARTKSLLKTLNSPYHNPIKSISTFSFLSQEPQLATAAADPPPHSEPTPLPPNPASGSPLYNENWRSPIPPPPPSSSSSSSPSILPLIPHSFSARLQSVSQNPDVESLLNMFADWMTSQRWSEMKQFFEFWIRSLDKNGKPNKPDVNLYNHYLRANLMLGASAGELLDLLTQMDNFAITPNTASYNLVLKAMFEAKETDAAEKLLRRMEETGQESQPSDETYDLIIKMLFATERTDAALKYVEKVLKGGYMLTTAVFNECVKNCIFKGKLDALGSIIDKIKTMDQNKALSPTWNMCGAIVDAAMQENNSKLAFYGLEFMAKWMVRGENARPSVVLSVEEGLVVSALSVAARTYSSTLLDASWAILRRSLRQKKAPNPESFIAKIYAHASLGNLQKAFATLREFESAYEGSDKEVAEQLFSPFTSLYPLVVACCKKGFETLDMVYYQLENLSHGEHPYKSVAALNCIILGCANIWDLDRAYQTFEAINSSFQLTPDIHSYNALMFAFGRLKKTFEASRVFEHLVSMGIKPNAMSYSLLVDAHLISKDVKAAVSVIEEMVSAGFVPTKETLKKVRRRCMREMDYESDDRVDSLAKRFKIRLGSEGRRNLLFNLEYSTEYA